MIDSALQTNLRQKFNPDGSNIRNMQLRMLEMLNYIDKICKENNITYWLSSGTCLGAIRHGGFIPWDDDVDIELKKKDYKKLIKILKSQKNSRYLLQDSESDPDYLHPYAKLRDLNSEVKEDNIYEKWCKYRGCFIDIFCLESSNFLWINKVSASLWWHLVSRLSGIKNSTFRKCSIKVSRNILLEIVYPLLRLINNISKSNKYRHTLGVGFFKERYSEDISSVRYVKFENTSLPVPINSDHYLATIYGNYNYLPHIEDIHPHFVSVKILD